MVGNVLLKTFRGLFRMPCDVRRLPIHDDGHIGTVCRQDVIGYKKETVVFCASV